MAAFCFSFQEKGCKKQMVIKGPTAFLCNKEQCSLSSLLDRVHAPCQLTKSEKAGMAPGLVTFILLLK